MPVPPKEYVLDLLGLKLEGLAHTTGCHSALTVIGRDYSQHRIRFNMAGLVSQRLTRLELTEARSIFEFVVLVGNQLQLK